jgi:hypothetical protein
LETKVGAFARVAKTTTQSKSSTSSGSVRKKKSSASAHANRKHTKARSSAAHSPSGEHFEGFHDLPPEELPVPEDEDPPNP